MRSARIGNAILFNGDNRYIMDNHLRRVEYYEPFVQFDVIYADCIYESKDYDWIYSCYELLKPDGIFYVQTDYHTVADYKIYLDALYGTDDFLNWLIYKQEWGGTSKRFFPRKHDDILMYAKGEYYKFYPERIQIPKVTAGTAFDKKGTGLKTPCDVFDDLGNFSTISNERIKDSNGKNIQWQKPLKLMERLLLSTTDEGDYILDPFGGTFTTGEWCLRNSRNFFGIELDEEIYTIGLKRLLKVEKELNEKI